MEIDNRQHECDRPAQDIPRRLAALWDNQLQLIKQRAEGQAKGTQVPARALDVATDTR
jgi:DICT domain-containing protein